MSTTILMMHILPLAGRAILVCYFSIRQTHSRIKTLCMYSDSQQTARQSFCTTFRNLYPVVKTL